MRQHTDPIEDCFCPKCARRLNSTDKLYQLEGNDWCCEECSREEIGRYPRASAGDSAAQLSFETLAQYLEIKIRPAPSYWEERAREFAE